MLRYFLEDVVAVLDSVPAMAVVVSTRCIDSMH
jgi:hypothetical protein